MPRKTVSRNIAYDDRKRCYYVTFHYGTGPDGQRIKHTKTYHDYDAARDALQQFEEQHQYNRAIRLGGEMTLEVWLQYWLEEIIRPNRAKTTAYGYENIIRNHLVPALGSVQLYRLESIQIQRYYTQTLKKGLSPSSVRKHHVLLHTALSMAVKQKVLRENCMEGVVPPQVAVPQHHFYNAAQMRQLFELSEGHPLELAVKLAGYLGMRRSEICGLRWDSVNLERGVLYIRRARTVIGGKIVEKGTKTAASERQLSFASIPDLALLLRRRWNENQKRQLHCRQYNPENYVLVSNEGKPYQPDYVSVWFSRFIQRNNLPPLTIHGLRHSFASVANSQKISLFDIGKVLGHSNTTTTSRIYTHLFDETHQDTISQVAVAIAGNDS